MDKINISQIFMEMSKVVISGNGDVENLLNKYQSYLGKDIEFKEEIKNAIVILERIIELQEKVNKNSKKGFFSFKKKNSISIRKKVIIILFIVLLISQVYALSSSFKGDVNIENNTFIGGNLTVFDLTVRSGASITLANLTIESRGHYTQFDEDLLINESDEPTAFLGVQATNISNNTHANLILQAGDSIFNIVKNSQWNIFSPNASGILNDGPHGTFVESPFRISWWQFDSLNKDEFGNIINLTNLSLLMTLNDSALHIRGGDIIVNGSVNITGSFVGDGSGLTGIDDLWINVSGNATYTDGRVGIGTTTPSGIFTVGNEAYSISTATFIQNFNASAQGGANTGLAFSVDGTKMFMILASNDHVFEYNLSDAYNISTAVLVQNFSIQSEDAAPRGLDFNDDGTKMYFPGNVGDNVYEYNLSDAYNISTAVFTQLFSIDDAPNFEDVPLGLDFSRDGTKMFLEGNDNDAVEEYNLSTAFDISTAVFVQLFSFSDKTVTPRGLRFNPDGDKMLIGATDICQILLYELSDPHNISTAVFSQSLNISEQNCSPTGIDFNNDGSKLFYLTLGGIVNEFDLSIELLVLKDDGNLTIDVDTLFVDAKNNRVGIGTTTPNQKLQVRGSLNVSGTSYLSDIIINSANVSGDVNISGKLLVNNGTELLPSYTFFNDPSTGMYLNVTGLLRLVSNGLNILQLNSSKLTAKSYATISNGYDQDGGTPFITYGVESNETQTALYVTSKGGESININVGSLDGDINIGRAIVTGQGTIKVGTNGAVSIGTQTNLGPSNADGNVLILGASTSFTETRMILRSPANSQDFKIGINNLAVDNGSVFFNTVGTEMRLQTINGTAISISGLDVSIGDDLNITGSLFQPVYASEDGLILYLPFSEPNGSTQYDRSPYGNDGTPTGGVACNSTNAKYGNGCEFDGTNDEINTASDFSSQITGIDTVTISGWVNPSITPSVFDAFFGIRSGSVNFYVLRLSGTNNLECRINTGSGSGFIDASPTPTITPGVWQHIALVYNGSNIFCYINGVQEGTATVSGNFASSSLPFDVGNDVNNNFFEGFIDEVRMYSRALSEDEIRTQYLRGSGFGASGAIVADKFRIINTTGSNVFEFNSTDLTFKDGDWSFTNNILVGQNVTSGNRFIMPGGGSIGDNSSCAFIFYDSSGTEVLLVMSPVVVLIVNVEVSLSEKLATEEDASVAVIELLKLVLIS